MAKAPRPIVLVVPTPIKPSNCHLWKKPTTTFPYRSSGIPNRLATTRDLRVSMHRAQQSNGGFPAERHNPNPISQPILKRHDVTDCIAVRQNAITICPFRDASDFSASSSNRMSDEMTSILSCNSMRTHRPCLAQWRCAQGTWDTSSVDLPPFSGIRMILLSEPDPSVYNTQSPSLVTFGSSWSPGPVTNGSATSLSNRCL